MKIDWFYSEKYFFTDFTVKSIFSLMNQWKLTDLTVKNIFSLMNQWKGKSLIQSVKIWLIQI